MDLALRRLQESGDEPQRRGLAAAGGTQQAYQLPMLDPQRDLIDDRERSKSLGQAAHINGRQSSSSLSSFVPSFLGAERRSNPERLYPNSGLRRGACHRARIRATRWLAMTVSSSTDTFAEPLNRGLEASLAVRDRKRVEADFDDTQRAQDHRRVDVPHMGDPERLARKFADPALAHHAAFLPALTLQRQRIVTACHQHGGDRIRPLSGFRDVEAEHLAFGPDP